MGSPLASQNQQNQLTSEEIAALRNMATTVPGAAGNVMQTQQPAPPPTTYSALQPILEDLPKGSGVNLNIPVVNPAQEAFNTGQLSDLEALKAAMQPKFDEDGNLIEGTGFATPGFAEFVAGLSPNQSAGINLATTGVGGYQPFLDIGTGYFADAGGTADTLTNLVGGATGLGGQATGAAAGGADVAFGRIGDVDRRIAGLEAGGATSFDPSDISSFMNPFEDEVVQRALSDIQTESDKARQQRRAEAAAAGAFGGSRAGAVEAQLDRATLEQQAQTAAELRRAGFESAAGRAQKAFEDQQNRFLSANQLGLGSLIDAGQLGLGAGELGLKGITTGLAGTELGANILSDQSGLLSGLGDSQSDLAARISGLRALDTETLLNIGGLQQDQNQRVKDAIYADRLAAIRDPYTQLQILSDIFNQVPYSQSALSVRSAPGGAPAVNRGGVLTGGGVAAVGYGLDALRRG